MATEILNDAEFRYYYELINGKKFRTTSRLKKIFTRRKASKSIGLSTLT